MTSRFARGLCGTVYGLSLILPVLSGGIPVPCGGGGGGGGYAPGVLALVVAPFVPPLAFPWSANLLFALGLVLLPRSPVTASVLGSAALVVGSVGTLAVAGVPAASLALGFVAWLGSFLNLAAVGLVHRR